MSTQSPSTASTSTRWALIVGGGLAALAIVLGTWAAVEYSSTTQSAGYHNPTSRELTAALPAADRSGSLTHIRYADGLASGVYDDAHGRPTTGVFRDVHGTWELQDRYEICRILAHLPSELARTDCQTI